MTCIRMAAACPDTGAALGRTFNPHCPALAGAALLGLVLASTAGLAAPLFIDTEITVAPYTSYGVGPGSITPGGSPVTEVQITPTGHVHSRSSNSTVGFAVPTRNEGQVRVGFATEYTGGLGISNFFINAPGALIETALLNVATGGDLHNRATGQLITGRFTQADGQSPTWVQAAGIVAPGFGFAIQGQASVNNVATGTWLNHADGLVLGTVLNAGTFDSRNNPQTTLPLAGPYTQTITVGRSDSAVRQGYILNSGTMVLGQGTLLQNFGNIDNVGQVMVRGGSLSLLNSSLFTNGANGGVTVSDGGRLLAQTNGGGAVVNVGVINIASTGVLDNFGLLRNDDGVIQIEVGGKLQNNHANGAELHMRGGAVVVAGDFSGGRVTNDTSVAFGMGGTVRIEPRGSMSVVEYTQRDGLLIVNGTLTGTVNILGGTLQGGVPKDAAGNPIGDGGGRINGDVFVGGSGGAGLPQPPACGSATVACFKPGNSPGHMVIDGALTMGANSILEMEIERGADGALRWDSVFANSFEFDADSIIRVLVGDGVDNDTDLNFDFLNCPGGCQFGSFGLPHFEVFGGHGNLYADAGRLMFRLDAVGGGGGGGNVPEPATLYLLALGSLILAMRRGTAQGSGHGC